MSSTGYVDPTSNKGVSYETDMQIGTTYEVGEAKLGAVNTIPNSVAGPAVRQKAIDFSLTAATETSIAHGLVDENGNPATPDTVTFKVQSTATVFSSKAPDATNIYLTDASATSGTPTTGTVVVTY